MPGPGIQLGITTWVRPYANPQSEILDFLEFVLLCVRFVLFSTVAALLIFLPSSSVVWIWATFLIVLLAAAAAYAGLHFLAQVLRTVSNELKMDTEQEMQEPQIDFPKVQGTKEKLMKVARISVDWLRTMFEPDEQLKFRWSADQAMPDLSEPNEKKERLIPRLRSSQAADSLSHRSGPKGPIFPAPCHDPDTCAC